MIKQKGKVYDYVRSELETSGVTGLDSLGIATLGRGSDHLIILKGEVIGSYNHKSKEIYLYPNTPAKG